MRATSRFARTQSWKPADSGHWNIAQKLIESGLQTHPAEAELLALSGFVCLPAQRYGDAEGALSAALEQGLSAAELHYKLAFALFMQRRYSDALERLLPPAVGQAVHSRAGYCP